MTDKPFIVSLSPHGHSGRTVRGLIVTTMLALTPAALWGVYQFGLPALTILLLGIGGAVGTEALINAIARQPLTIKDAHAALVGLTIAMLMPSGAPWWLVLVAAVAAIAVGKAPFGPLGGSPLSPALIGLLIVALSWPQEVKRHLHPRTARAETKVAGAMLPESPQTAVQADPSDARDLDVVQLFLGHQVGRIGVVSPLLLLLGGLLLIWRRAARWQGPVGYLVGLALVAGIMHGLDPGHYASVGFQAFTGVAMFGAFFLCTEWSCTPVSSRGLLLFGLIAGALTIVLRMSGLPSCRVPFAIVLTSLCTPLLDRVTVTPFGKKVRHA